MLAAMIDLCKLIWWAFAGLFRSRAALEAEILVALRHQLNVLRRKSPGRLAFSSIDRLVLVGACTLAPNVLEALKIVKPETVVPVENSNPPISMVQSAQNGRDNGYGPRCLDGAWEWRVFA